MKNIGVLLGMLLLFLVCCQCTEDEEIEAKVYQDEILNLDSGDEGDQGSENTRD